MGVLERVRKRREPEKTVLYQVLAEHLETFLARVEGDVSRGGLPWFVVRELRAFLDCGILARGLSQVHCSDCGKNALVAHSCKRRGFCPSCGARRMADTAAHLVDRVLPDVPVRQWVLALPHRVRFWCAYDPELCRGVRRISVRAIASFYKSRARDRGIHDPRTGCVVFAATSGTTALGPDAGRPTPRLGRGTADAGGEFSRGKLRADCDGLSLHAGVRIRGFCRDRLHTLIERSNGSRRWSHGHAST